MDPLVVTALVSGAAGAFVKNLSEKGVDWLVSLVAAQSPAAQEQIQKNTQNFLGRLAQRVERLEKDVEASNKSEIFSDALAHPSSSLMLKKALTSAAATDNGVRHSVLSELIAQRLQSGAEDMIALAGNAACDVILSLSVRQISLLATLVSVQTIGPLTKFNVNSSEQADAIFRDWVVKNVRPLYELTKANGEITSLDFDHLVALSCLSMSIGSKDLLSIHKSKLFDKPDEHPVRVTLDDDCWPLGFLQMWDRHGSHASLTSIGTLIGVLHRDSVLKSNTLIQW
jgi:hypothetical protein